MKLSGSMDCGATTTFGILSIFGCGRRTSGAAWAARFLARRVREARAGGATELLIKSDPNAEPFYLRMGAERVQVETYLLLGAIPRTVPHLRFGW